MTNPKTTDGEDLFVSDVCTKHEADYEQIVQCNDCAVYTNSQHADMERKRIGEARRDSANEVIGKITKWSSLNMKYEFSKLSEYLDSLSNQYKEKGK